ncbi:4-azaleucine resistance transporter AzlC [Haloarcula quadrata]|jgi:4-azaleucine resistance transporter AzlC|uniref:Branched-chain amino acid ABC transporter permease n=5 Tax=Haloarcula TaxID=2237 RepID=Q5V111_HALMA|nr:MULTISPECIES: AzlC family ABC transporter permease [Haloarcula]AAV46792.1 branched-chain amino acid transport protein AzlC [Haloarcula marismortui ATCC 43049]EMA15467.1 branched-chain amino acid transport protein AzlC [Haloarcula sinaiiensis ATCC 33800]EMA20479.1 branched-chain amino acid transport protein AzlC [Haloarcula californiae ATCC 33799]KAA9410650.1 branched-chain amino acid ABC transporter permease [Haloarcula hispanica]NHN61843.1 AzlC family ABC transporter permease [Haloarcula s
MDTASFRRGVRDVAPLLLGIIPFGLVAGIATVNAGLGLPAAVGLSVVVFAGASQLAALELLGQNAPLTVVVATAVVINLRLLMYSASIAPYFRNFTGRWKAMLAYVLTDQAYALSVASYRSDSETDRKWYYLGVAVTLWAVWQVTTIAGALLGTGVPDAWGLEFAIPLVFLAILVPAIEDAATAVAAAVGGAIAVVGAGLPLNLGLLVAAGVGITAGVLTESATGGTDGD